MEIKAITLTVNGNDKPAETEEALKEALKNALENKCSSEKIGEIVDQIMDHINEDIRDTAIAVKALNTWEDEKAVILEAVKDDEDYKCSERASAYFFAAGFKAAVDDFLAYEACQNKKAASDPDEENCTCDEVPEP